MARANVVCASLEIDPKDIAPVANLLTIFSAVSTSVISIEVLLMFNLNNPLGVIACSD